MSTPGADGEDNNYSSNQNATVANSLGPLLSQASNDIDDATPSSPESIFSECNDLKAAVMEDEVPAQMATTDAVGTAAASGIASGRRRRRLYSFETHPSIRKRQQHRLLKKLRQTVDEFATRVGQQAVVLAVKPDDLNSSYKVFGTQPLEGVVKRLEPTIMKKLKCALKENITLPVQEDPDLFALPPIIIDGIPTPLDQMTQAQLRAFIPLMLKYSTGRGKPGWGKESNRPPWWPEEIPWENVRLDSRSEEEKKKMSWTIALRHIIFSCYKYHGREDLINIANEEEDNKECKFLPTTEMYAITNPDGTINIVHLSPNNAIITIPDSTTPDVQILDSSPTTQSDGSVNNVQPIAEDNEEIKIIGLNCHPQDGNIFLISEDGHSYPTTINRMSKTIVPNIKHSQTKNDGSMSILTVTPPKLEPIRKENIQIPGMAPGVTHQIMIEGAGNDPPQVLQVISLQEDVLLTNATSIDDVKTEETINEDEVML